MNSCVLSFIEQTCTVYKHSARRPLGAGRTVSGQLRLSRDPGEGSLVPGETDSTEGSLGRCPQLRSPQPGLVAPPTAHTGGSAINAETRVRRMGWEQRGCGGRNELQMLPRTRCSRPWSPPASVVGTSCGCSPGLRGPSHPLGSAFWKGPSEAPLQKIYSSALGAPGR